MAYTCVMKGCNNSLRKLKKWEEAECNIHNCSRLSELCDCHSGNFRTLTIYFYWCSISF